MHGLYTEAILGHKPALGLTYNVCLHLFGFLKFEIQTVKKISHLIRDSFIYCIKGYFPFSEDLMRPIHSLTTALYLIQSNKE